jgi:hypothetical protein
MCGQNVEFKSCEKGDACAVVTCSMEQSPSCEANWFSARQDIPRILWNDSTCGRCGRELCLCLCSVASVSLLSVQRSGVSVPKPYSANFETAVRFFTAGLIAVFDRQWSSFQTIVRHLDEKHTSVSAPLTPRNREWVNNSHFGKPRKTWVHSNYSPISDPLTYTIYSLFSTAHTTLVRDVLDREYTRSAQQPSDPYDAKSVTNNTLICKLGATSNYQHPSACASTITTFQAQTPITYIPAPIATQPTTSLERAPNSTYEHVLMTTPCSLTKRKAKVTTHTHGKL